MLLLLPFDIVLILLASLLSHLRMPFKILSLPSFLDEIVSLITKLFP